jgi:hypothetical protein
MELCFSVTLDFNRACGAVVFEALRYKPEGRRFDSRWCLDFFHLHNPSGRTMALGSTQPLTEMSTRNMYYPTCFGSNKPSTKAAGA